MRRTIAALTTLAALSIAGPAHAVSQPGDFKARFYGHCGANYVAFWRIEPPTGVDPATYGSEDVEIDARRHPVKSEVMYAGDYDEVHRRFRSNGRPKTVEVYVDNVLVAQRTYWCGFYNR